MNTIFVKAISILSSFLSSFINYKLKVHYAHDTGIDALSAFRRPQMWYRGKLLKKYLVDAEKEEQTVVEAIPAK